MITFKSKAAQDLIVLPDFANYVLGVIGKHLGERGVITHEELAAAIAKLEDAIHAVSHHDGKKLGQHREEPQEQEDTFLHAKIGLQTRLAPFIGMLREAEAQGADVHWGF